MRVGLGVTSLIKGTSNLTVDGIGNYTNQIYGLLKTRNDIDVKAISFGHTSLNTTVNPVDIFHKFKLSTAISIITGKPFVGSNLLNGKIDLFHSTDHYIPKYASIPVLATIHDAIPLAHPEWVSFKFRNLFAPALKRSAQWAEHILTVSHFSKIQIAEHYLIPEARITVVPNGVSNVWRNPINYDLLYTIKNRLSINRQYIIFVGTLQPRKNIYRLIMAYKALPEILRSSFSLIIIGRYGWGVDDLLRLLRNEESCNEILWFNNIQDFELVELVKGASCLALPSLSEGFGLPILEAFAAGVPVLTSNLTSLPEVASDSAFLVDPYDIDAISYGLHRILDDQTLATILRKKGRQRSLLYTWERTVDETIAVYNRFV